MGFYKICTMGINPLSLNTAYNIREIQEYIYE